MNARAVMARTLARILRQGVTLDDALRYELASHPADADSGLIQEVCYGVVRHYQALDYAAARLLNKPLRPKDQDIKALILCGLYQLHHLNMAEYAAISETVAAATALKKRWAGPLVNATLRRSQRECRGKRDSIGLGDHQDDPLSDNAERRYLHPHWMIRQVRQDWPQRWQRILAANNRRPPQHLRVNLQKISRTNYLRMLAANGIRAEAIEGIPTAVRITQAVGVARLPGFNRGLCSVQDAGAQLAALILRPQAGERVLDGCAAPGGKTTHLYEQSQGAAQLLALDISPSRCELLRDGLRRSGARATVICTDLLNMADWWDGRGFDRILLDVPCSASGVIRRHPDIKLLRQADQLPALRQRQLALLHGAWPTLNAGGTLLYCTCSIFRAENDAVIAAFSRVQTDAIIQRIQTDMGVASEHGRQLLPDSQNGMQDTDGFYYALLMKAK